MSQLSEPNASISCAMSTQAVCYSFYSIANFKAKCKCFFGFCAEFFANGVAASAKIKRHPCMRDAARITFLRCFAEFVHSFAWMPQILYHCYS